MKKLCFSCFRRIPLFAGKCPYCLDKHQGVYGRIIIAILVVLAIFLSIEYYDNKQKPYSVDEVIHELKE